MPRNLALLDVDAALHKANIDASRVIGYEVAAAEEELVDLFDLVRLELSVTVRVLSETEAFYLARAMLKHDDIPAALAVLRGWLNNPRRTR